MLRDRTNGYLRRLPESVVWLLGLIPFLGAVPDLFFRSNSRNLRIIKRHLDKHHPASRVIDG